MKKIIFSFLSLAIVALMFTSCEQTYDDFMTGDVQTGGLVSPLKSFPYKLGGTTTFDVSVDIPKGPGIVTIEVYKTYTGKAEVLHGTIDVASANANDNVTKSMSLDYAALINGLGMPADESELLIGDSWTLSYVSIMEDGRSVKNGAKTAIGVANFFAGDYNAHILYHHPSVGDYPNNIAVEETNEKGLIATSANTCKTEFAVWDNECWITINSDNSITFVVSDTWSYDVSLGVPDHPELVSSYDPATGTIQLYYNYMGSGGYRIFHETFTVAN
ncbi:MAG: hypothetical protein HQ521_16070 [Bacteroidetes bacterium]|nr:hypothetical protein [Bacteroidota bacterium]